MRHAGILAALLAVFSVAGPAAMAFQVAEPRDTIRIEERDGRELKIYLDDEGRVVIEGLDLDEGELSVAALRRALDQRSVRARAFALRGEMPDPRLLADLLGERFRAGVHRDSLPIDLDDLRIRHRAVPRGLGSLALHMGTREETEARREIAELESEVRLLARDAREAEGAERARLEEELDEKLSELFERRHQLRWRRLERLREQAAREEEELAERERARREIIERRKRELLGKRDRLEW